MGRTSRNRSNGFYDRNMNRVETTQVRQIADRAFFHRGGRWLDSRVVEREKTLTPDETARSGTPEYASLVNQLIISEGRQGMLALPGEAVLLMDDRTILKKQRVGETR